MPSRNPDVLILAPDSEMNFAEALGKRLIEIRPELEFALMPAELKRPVRGPEANSLILVAGKGSEHLLDLSTIKRLAITMADRALVVVTHDVEVETMALPARHVIAINGELEQADMSGLILLANTVSRRVPSEIQADDSIRQRPDGSIVSNPALLQRIDGLDLADRIIEALEDQGVIYVGDLVELNSEQVFGLISKRGGSIDADIDDIDRALNHTGFSLGDRLTFWRPDNLEEQLRWLDAARTATALTQARVGAIFDVRDDHLVIDPVGRDSDLDASARPIARQLHDQIRQKLKILSPLAARLGNQPGWHGLANLVEGLHALLDRPTSDIPDVLGLIYSSAIELGTYVEQDQALLAGAKSSALPLDADVRRPLDDLLRTFAPWLRSFPSVREMDDETGNFLTRAQDLKPTAAVIEAARTTTLISQSDAAALTALVDAAGRGENLGGKAGGRARMSARNLVAVAASVIGSFCVGSVASDFAPQSIVAQKSATFLVHAEHAIIALVADLPADLRISIVDLVHTGSGAPLLPDAPPIAPEPSDTFIGRSRQSPDERHI